MEQSIKNSQEGVIGCRSSTLTASLWEGLADLTATSAMMWAVPVSPAHIPPMRVLQYGSQEDKVVALGGPASQPVMLT